MAGVVGDTLRTSSRHWSPSNATIMLQILVHLVTVSGENGGTRAMVLTYTLALRVTNDQTDGSQLRSLQPLSQEDLHPFSQSTVFSTFVGFFSFTSSHDLLLGE